MVYSHIVTFDLYPLDSTKDNYFERSIGERHEDRGYGILSRELKNHETSIRC